jgi:hypothetical protein
MTDGGVVFIVDDLYLRGPTVALLARNLSITVTYVTLISTATIHDLRQRLASA